MPDFDDWIDAQLRNVPLPPDLLWRLAECGHGGDDTTANARLDAVLSNVPLPDDLESRLRRIALERRPASRWRRYGLAASIFVVLGAAGYLGLVTMVPRAARSTVSHSPATHSTVASPAVSVSNVEASQVSTNVPSVPANALPVAPVSPPPMKRLATTDRADSEAIDNSQSPATDQRARLPFNLADITALGSSLKQAFEARPQAALGAEGGFDRLPQLDAFEAPVARGIAPPRVRGYDLLFQLKQGEHPFASPAAHRLLASSRVPFSFHTASYDQAVGSARDGELPSGEEIRVEDFLAAQEYILPPAPMHSLALHVAASPSPFGEEGLHLLQLAVKAGPKRAPRRQATHLLVVLDASSRMAVAGRWETALRALAALAGDLLPTDRITLIGCGDKPRVLSERATPVELKALVSSDALARPLGYADFGAAVQAACEAVETDPDGAQRRVVCITAGREMRGASALAKLDRSLAQLTANQVPWQIVCLASGERDSQLAKLARRPEGEVVVAASAGEIRAALVEKLTGQSATVATGASLKLSFNPKVVTGYRLLGHASSTITGESADPLEVDLRSNQTATAMFELWIKSDGSEPIAAAELSWHDPLSTQPRRVSRTIRRDQIAASFSEAAPWLQQGIIAAKTAEALRGSYYAPATRPLAQIHELTGKVDPKTAEQSEFQSLVRLLEEAQALR